MTSPLILPSLPSPYKPQSKPITALYKSKDHPSLQPAYDIPSQEHIITAHARHSSLELIAVATHTPEQNTLRIYKDHEIYRTYIDSFSEQITHIQFIAKERILVTSLDGLITILKYKHEDEEDAYYAVMNAQQPIQECLVLEDQKMVVVTTAQGTVQIWDMKEQSVVAQYDELEDVIQPFRIGGQILVAIQTASEENASSVSIHHWQAEEGKLDVIATVSNVFTSPVLCVLYENERLYTGTESGVVGVYCCKDLSMYLQKFGKGTPDQSGKSGSASGGKKKKRAVPY